MKRSVTEAGNAGAPIGFLRMLFRHLHAADPYLPERHYMRGPGPKSRVKRGLPGGTL